MSATEPTGPRDRFVAAVRHLLPETYAPLALAVSGGADSMAMLVLAHAAFPDRVIAATVDHRLRSASADDAAMVAAHCATLGVPHATLVPAMPIAGASLQAQARAARYALLLGWAREHDAAALLTAHHADDQAETFLMRAARGSGLSGLAGIRARQEQGRVTIARPLLDWRRAELRAIVLAAGTPFIDDPANADDRHDRTHFRRLLAANAWLDAPGLAQAAGQLAELDAELRAVVDALFATRTRPAAAGEARLDMTDLPRELRRRLVRRAIDAVRDGAGITARASHEQRGIEPLLDALDRGGAATQAGVRAAAKGFALALPSRPAAPRDLIGPARALFHCH